MGKVRIMWTRNMEFFVLDLWSENINDLQALKKNGHIYEDMATSLNLRFGIKDMTKKDIQVKIHNLTQKYRQERKLISASGAYSNWPLYERINKMLIKENKTGRKANLPDSASLSEAKSSYEGEDSRNGEYEDDISIEETKLIPNLAENITVKSSKSQPFSRQPTTDQIVDQINNIHRINENCNQEKPYDQFGKYVAAELRELPQRQAILLQHDLQNCITRAKLSCLELIQSSYSNYKDKNNANIISNSTHSNVITRSNRIATEFSNHRTQPINQELINTFIEGEK